MIAIKICDVCAEADIEILQNGIMGVSYEKNYVF